jgi:hypothetical protein
LTAIAVVIPQSHHYAFDDVLPLGLAFLDLFNALALAAICAKERTSTVKEQFPNVLFLRVCFIT